MTASKLAPFDAQDRAKIVALSKKLLMQRVLDGDVEATAEAVKAAAPQAIDDAIQAVSATTDFLAKANMP